MLNFRENRIFFTVLKKVLMKSKKFKEDSCEKIMKKIKLNGKIEL